MMREKRFNNLPLDSLKQWIYVKTCNVIFYYDRAFLISVFNYYIILWETLSFCLSTFNAALIKLWFMLETSVEFSESFTI